jgi:NAD(P)-dependent dehydrogenase (short-subunit alcohol dehydrogenase family)
MSEQKVVLITGGSSGIGQATASLLADRGFKVFGTSRKPLSDKADGFVMLKLDVNSDESVNACVQAVLQRTGRVDILINNAGHSLGGAIEETSIQEAKSQFETNFFGVVRMVKIILPIMREQMRGHIINISSISGLIAQPFGGFYSASKFALEGYTEALRHEVKRFNITVSLIEPGFFKTNILNVARRTAETINDYVETRRRVFSISQEGVQNGLNPYIVADTVLRVINSRSPRLRYLVGKETWAPRLKRIMPESVIEWATRRYWKLDD